MLDQTVIGTTPQRVTLPCGAPIDLLIRKPHLAQVTKTITPLPDVAPLSAVLVKQTLLASSRISSTPEGATVTLDGKPLGVTPTTVRVPAFESSALYLTKDGYETETVTPKDNSGMVHTVLKRLERKKPR